MKKILMCLSLCFMLFGCTSKVDYERSSEMATINNASWAEVMSRIDEDETFMFMVTYDECSSCEFFIENVLSNYLVDHGFELNRVNFNDDMWSELKDEVRNFVLNHPYSNDIVIKVDGYEAGMLLTPTLYFIENGEIKDMLVGGDIKEADLDSMIMKYRLDEVK